MGYIYRPTVKAGVLCDEHFQIHQCLFTGVWIPWIVLVMNPHTTWCMVAYSIVIFLHKLPEMRIFMGLFWLWRCTIGFIAVDKIKNTPVRAHSVKILILAISSHLTLRARTEDSMQWVFFWGDSVFWLPLPLHVHVCVPYYIFGLKCWCTSMIYPCIGLQLFLNHPFY